MAGSVATERASAEVSRRDPGKGFSWGRLAGLAVLVLGALIFLFPFYYMVVGALQREPKTDITSAFPNPANLTLANFGDINAQVDLVRTLINSGIFTAGALLATFVIGLLAGYALARLDFRGRNVVFNAMLLILVLPFQLFMIPLYVLIVRTYGLSDNYLGMILPFGVNATAVFIFRQFFLQLPPELFESARIDGASELRIFLRLILPLGLPAIASLAIFQFLWTWNDLLVALTFGRDTRPITVAILSQLSEFGSSIEIIAPASFISLVLPLAVFFAFQRYFVEGPLAGSVK
jgi:multiple sugar transport system permease protein